MGRSKAYCVLFALSLLVLIGFGARRGIGLSVETDGGLFASGMMDEVNVTLTNRDNHQIKVVAQLVAVEPGSLIPTGQLGDEAVSAATLNSGDKRLLTMALDTGGLETGRRYKIGVLVFENTNSTDFPVPGSLLAVSYVSDIEICDPLEIVNANASLCNEVAIIGMGHDRTTP